MSSLYLVANSVFFTSYGHIQFVFDTDGVFENGNEKEIEVQPTSLGFGNWDVSPVQDLDLPFGSVDRTVELPITDGRDVEDVWDLLVSARDFFAGLTIDYRLGITGSAEGQNSNSYIATLAHITGLDISSAVSTFLSSSSLGSFPGLSRNVLFDHIDDDGNALPPVAVQLSGTSGIDFIAGGSGSDTLDGASGDDTLNGHGDDDTLNGGSGRDKLFGGEGDDRLNGNNGQDRLEGQSGDDVLYGHGQNDRLIGGAGHDQAWGGNGSDRISGNNGQDMLWGNGGNDDLIGGLGQDQLWGQRGSDLLNGMKGDDVMSGGKDADIFVFDGRINEGQDEITDFEIGVDLIRIEGLVFSDLVIGGGSTAVIVLDQKTEISLTGVAQTEIGADSFEFLIA